MTTEEAITWFERRHIDSDGYTSDFQKACTLAIAALRTQQEQENPKPLTLDELREMGVEPVWVECIFNKDLSSYTIIERGNNGIYTSLFFADFEYYGDEWLAYRHKPKEY